MNFAENSAVAPFADAADHATQVPGYQVLGELGQGATGVVYRAKHLKLNRVVALKILPTAGHGESLKRARTECEAVAQLQHPNIVQIFDVMEIANAFVIAFEYVDGGTLEPVNVTRPGEIAELLEVVARAIQHAHEQGVIHRDLKPGNILLTSDGVPKVADFGLAKMESVDANLTQAGSIMGTPHYMAPEQAYGHVHRMGPATDVYSLGTILYELLTGEQPFHDSDILSLLKKIRTSPPARPSRLKAGVPTDLETICLKCLEKKPWDRYATAAALADDLRLYLDGEPIQAKPEGRLKQSLAWVKRSRKSVIALVSSVLATIVLWFFVSSLREQASQMSAKESVVIQQPEGLPEFNVPMSNPLTHGKVELGRMLFFDRRLSLDSSVACVDCHNPEKRWSDASRVSQGIRQQMGTRNSISVANVAYQHFLFWDGRATSLEESRRTGAAANQQSCRNGNVD